MPIMHLYILIHLCIRHYLCSGHSPAQEKVFHNLHKTYLGYIKFSNNMSGWSSSYLDINGGWGTKYIEWYNWDYYRPTNKERGRAIIFLKRNAAMLLPE